MSRRAGYQTFDLVTVAEAVLCGQTIDEYEPDGASAKEFAALADAIGNLPL